jgi:hypothetical protein
MSSFVKLSGHQTSDTSQTSCLARGSKAMRGGLGPSLGVCLGEIANPAPFSAGLTRGYSRSPGGCATSREDGFLMRWCA